MGIKRENNISKQNRLNKSSLDIFNKKYIELNKNEKKSLIAIVTLVEMWWGS